MAVDKKGKKLPTGIRQRANGRYEGRIKYEYKSYSVYADTLTETKRKMTELKYKLEHGLFIPIEKITLDEWFETWMKEYKKNRIKVGTYSNYENYYRGAIQKKLGNQNISSIRGEHIQKLYNELVQEGYKISSIRIMSNVLHGCFKQAMINGLIDRNPIEAAELPKENGKHEATAMTKQEQILFMEYAKESYLYNLFAVMLRTGMRNGEIRGLKYTDIDRKKNVIHVRRTLKEIKGQGVFEDTPKTRTSNRDIPLTVDTVRLLDAQRKYWGFKVESFDRYLFCDEKGEPLKMGKVQTEINRICKKIKAAGYDFPHVTPHVFRHTFATRAIEAGMQPQVLKTILGHSSLAMTMDLYSHVLPDSKAEEMEKIANIF